MNTTVLPPKVLLAVPADRLKEPLIPAPPPNSPPTVVNAPKAPSSLFATACSKVEPKLRAAESALAAIESEHGTLALNDALGEPGATEALADHRNRTDAARETVNTLRAAHAAAVEYDSRQQRAALAELHKTKLRSVEQHFYARDKAAMDLTAALTNAATALKAMYDRSDKAQRCCPEGVQWPPQSLCAPGELHRLIAGEIYRIVSEGHPAGKCRFPGGATNIRDIEQPWAIAPLADVLKDATKITLDVLHGRRAA